MEEIKRMQQLAGLNEIKVNKPISKKELFEELIQYSLYLIVQLSESVNIEDFLSDGDYNNIDEFFEEEGYENKRPDLIENWFKLFKKDEIYSISLGDESYDELNYNLPQIYKNLKYIVEDGYGYIFLHNL